MSYPIHISCGGHNVTITESNAPLLAAAHKLLAACKSAKERLKPVESCMSNGDPIWFCQSCHSYIYRTTSDISGIVHESDCVFVALDSAISASTKQEPGQCPQVPT